MTLVYVYELTRKSEISENLVGAANQVKLRDEERWEAAGDSLHVMIALLLLLLPRPFSRALIHRRRETQ